MANDVFMSLGRIDTQDKTIFSKTEYFSIDLSKPLVCLNNRMYTLSFSKLYEDMTADERFLYIVKNGDKDYSCYVFDKEEVKFVLIGISTWGIKSYHNNYFEVRPDTITFKVNPSGIKSIIDKNDISMNGESKYVNAADKDLRLFTNIVRIGDTISGDLRRDMFKESYVKYSISQVIEGDTAHILIMAIGDSQIEPSSEYMKFDATWCHWEVADKFSLLAKTLFEMGFFDEFDCPGFYVKYTSSTPFIYEVDVIYKLGIKLSALRKEWKFSKCMYMAGSILWNKWEVREMNLNHYKEYLKLSSVRKNKSKDGIMMVSI